jgi:hypothetical protein
MAGQGLLELGVQARHLAQEGARVVAERVVDLVGHRQPRGAQHARLPELRHTRADQALVGGALIVAAQRIALRHQLGDGAFGIEDALALHFGGVRGQHRRHVGLRQRRRQFAARDGGALQALQRVRQRAGLAMVSLALVEHAAPHVVAILGDVGQVREIAEGADHAHGLVH